MEQKEITRAEGRSSVLLWFGLLGGPLVWSGQLLLNYGLEEAVVCAPGSGPGTLFLGMGIDTVIQIINSVAVAITLFALAVSFRCYRRLGGEDPTEGGRARWMAVAGMFNSTLFLFVISLKFASPFFLDPCTSPL